jgi:hypothetical protein
MTATSRILLPFSAARSSIIPASYSWAESRDLFLKYTYIIPLMGTQAIFIRYLEFAHQLFEIKKKKHWLELTSNKCFFFN